MTRVHNVRDQVFSVRIGVWQIIVNGKVVRAEWNSKGAAEAGIPVERARQKRKAEKITK